MTQKQRDHGVVLLFIKEPGGVPMIGRLVPSAPVAEIFEEGAAYVSGLSYVNSSREGFQFASAAFSIDVYSFVNARQFCVIARAPEHLARAYKTFLESAEQAYT